MLSLWVILLATMLGLLVSVEATQVYAAQKTDVDHFNATYGVYVATATPADTYEGKVLYTVFHPNSAEVYNYHITFDLNDGEGGPNDSLQVGEVTDNAIKLDPTEPTRNGYNFLGWCDQSSDGTTCPDGHLFQPGVELSLPDKNNKFVFYAVWKRYNPIPPECKGLAVGKTGSINDPRDNNSYSIAHLADGNCWMTQNLKLGGDDLTERHLNSSNTDINADDDFTMPVDDPNKSDFPDTSGDGEAHLEYSGNNNYGYYYNWYAATAGTGTKIQDHGDAHGSICPKGWRLPTKSEIDMLITKYDYASAENPPISLPFSGLCYAGNCPQNQGTYGFWWTSTASSATKAYYMYLYNTNAFGANDWWAKGTGFAVRCVAREENEI